MNRLEVTLETVTPLFLGWVTCPTSKEVISDR